MTLKKLASTYAATIAAGATLLGMASRAQAVSAIPTGDTSLNTPAQSATTIISNLADSVINIILLIAGAVAVIFLVWYGIQYITAGGTPDKAKAARAGIINAVIGIIVIAAAYFIIRFAVGVGGGIGSSTGL